MERILAFVVTAACLINGCSREDDRRPYVVIDSMWDKSNDGIHESVEPADSSVFFVTRYDPDRDPFEDLEAAVRAARAEKKCIILVVGGNWCRPCIEVARFWAEAESIRERLLRDFVVLKVNYGPLNHNERFLSQFPEVSSFPHIFVLDSNGRVLQSPGAEMASVLVDEEQFTKYLDRWAPEGRDRTM